MGLKNHKINSVRTETVVEETHFSGLVLVVDDESMIRRMLRRILERMGLQVLEARDGVEALDVYSANQESISVILLDWDMPRKDGNQTLRELRAGACSTPVLVLSGHGLNPEGYTPEAGQAQGFLKKPFRRLGLESHLREVLA